jgi:hypothetical protein
MRYFILFILLTLSVEGLNQIDSLTGDSSLVREKVPINFIDADKEAVTINDGNYYFLSLKEFWLALIVLSCLLVLIAFETWLIRTRNFSEDNTIKLLVITLVIMGTLFLIMAGYDDQIVAPAFALFGTIAGYIFGKSSNNPNNNNDKIE